MCALRGFILIIMNFVNDCLKGAGLSCFQSIRVVQYSRMTVHLCTLHILSGIGKLTIISELSLGQHIAQTLILLRMLGL